MMRQIRVQIEALKNKIDEASRLNELNIVDEVQLDQQKQMRQMAFIVEELRKEIEHYDDRARHEEEEIERMGNEKVIIQQDYIDSEQVLNIANSCSWKSILIEVYSLKKEIFWAGIWPSQTSYFCLNIVEGGSW